MILNLTQHPAAPAQREAGVAEPEDKGAVKALLTFDALPSSAEIGRRARALAAVADGEGAEAAMIGGAPWLMAKLEQELRARGIAPVFAFSRRESVEKTLPDGSVTKTNVFRHVGFVTPPLPTR